MAERLGGSEGGVGVEMYKKHRSERNKAKELEVKISISDFTKKSCTSKAMLVVKCLGSLSVVECLAKEKSSVSCRLL